MTMYQIGIVMVIAIPILVFSAIGITMYQGYLQQAYAEREVTMTMHGYPISYVTWDTVEYGDILNVLVDVTNTGNYSTELMMSSRPESSQYQVTWNYTHGYVLEVNQTIPILLTLMAIPHMPLGDEQLPKEIKTYVDVKK